MKAKHVRLIYGVILTDDGGLAPVVDYIEPFTLELLHPIDGVDKINVRPNTLRQVLDIHEKAARDARPGSRQYGEAVMRLNLEQRTDPVLTAAQLDQMAGVDYDALNRLIDSGTHPSTGQEAFSLRDDVDVTRDAYLKLHTMQDRKLAEQRLPTDGGDETVLFSAQLTWLVTRFGTPEAGMFDKRGDVPFAAFMNITWYDFQLLTRHLMMRDYKPLSEILEGRVDVGGKPTPFPGVPEDGDPSAKPKDGKRRVAGK